MPKEIGFLALCSSPRAIKTLFRMTLISAPARLLGLFLLAAVIAVGCSGGGSGYYVDSGEIADRYLPPTRTVDAHPDTLDDVSLKEREDGRPKIEMESGYKSLLLKWTTSYEVLSGRRPRQPLTYATFWSRELSLASLDAESGASTLSGDQGWKLIEQREREYKSFIQIDVYWYGRDRIVAGPGTRVQLKDLDGNTYEATRDEYTPLRETSLRNGQRALYRRNTFYFERVVDGKDILEGTQGIRLEVNQTGSGERWFTWEWDDPEAS